jgi:hypothetical protein
MVNFRSIADKAKDMVDKRGGTDSLKKDAAELKDIAKGPGGIGDKAKAAVAAVKDPGAKAEGKTAGSAEAPTSPPPREAAGKAKTDAAEKAGRKSRHKDEPGEVGGSK